MNPQSISKENMAQSNHSYDKEKIAVLILTEDGIIQDCNDAGAKLLGYRPGKSNRQHISEVLPRLSEIKLLKGKRVNPYLRFLSRIGHPFDVVGNNSIHFSGELFFNDLESQGQHQTVVMIHPIDQTKNLH
jgi:PAS domain-containing protein